MPGNEAAPEAGLESCRSVGRLCVRYYRLGLASGALPLDLAYFSVCTVNRPYRDVHECPFRVCTAQFPALCLSLEVFRGKSRKREASRLAVLGND